MPVPYIHRGNRRYTTEQENTPNTEVQSFAYRAFQVGLCSYAQCL